jgi:hypothetical protein
MSDIDSDTIEQVTKLMAAERQLKEAIKLFFEERDSISVCTLAGAANQILFDISAKRGIESMRNSIAVKDEYRKYWVAILNDAQNFFKHADRDPEREYEFHTETNVFLILDSLLMHGKLTQQIFIEARIFITWLFIVYPDLLKEGIFKNMVLQGLTNVAPPNYFAGFKKLLYDRLLRSSTG